MELFVAWINGLYSAVLFLGTAVSTGNTLESLVSGYALLDSVHELAHVNELVAAYLVVLVEIHLGDVTLGELEVTGALNLGTIESTSLRDKALAEVLEASTNHETTLREGRLGATVDDLEEELAHGGIDGVAYEVGIESLEDGLAGQNL